jgi:hypothetical protein
VTLGSGGAGRGTEYATPGQKGKEWTRGQGKDARSSSEIKKESFDKREKVLTRFCREENGAANFCIVLQDESSVISKGCQTPY